MKPFDRIVDANFGYDLPQETSFIDPRTGEEKPAKETGYDVVGPQGDYATMTLLSELGFEDGQFNYHPEEYANPNPPLAALNYLTVRGLLDRADDDIALTKEDAGATFVLTKNGEILARHSQQIRTHLDTFDDFSGHFEAIIGTDNGVEEVQNNQLESITEVLADKDQQILDSLLEPLAWGMLHEVRDGDFTMKDHFERGFKKASHVAVDLAEARKRFQSISPDTEVVFDRLLGILERRGAIESSGDQHYRFIDTNRNRAYLRLCGYHGLHGGSYLPTFSSLTDITQGRKMYAHRRPDGASADIPLIYRKDSNSIFSNALIQPALKKIVDFVKNSPLLQKILIEAAAKGRKVVFAEFGSGGGDMTRALKNAIPELYATIGVDFNEGVVNEARKLTNQPGVHFMHGDMTDPEIFQKIRTQLGEDIDILSITDFIPHDIGKEMTQHFLATCRENNPGKPLYITDSLQFSKKATFEDMRLHPNYQLPFFRLIHEFSGQELSDEQEFFEAFNLGKFKVLQKYPISYGRGRKHESFATIMATESIPA